MMGGCLFRQVNISYKEDYDQLMQSGLYDNLVSLGYLVAHEEVPMVAGVDSSAYKCIRPDMIEFISYPYEWCFNQLKDAALLTLAIEKIAFKHGMTLKDGSAFNIQFHKGKPIFIDTLSFTKKNDGMPWLPYKQFCQHFIAPLALMRYRDARLGRLFRLYLDGIPLDMCSRLLPRRTLLKIGIAFHIHLHAWSQRIFENRRRVEPPKKARLGRNAHQGFIENLEKTVSRLCWRSPKRGWGTYYEDDGHGEEYLGHKENLVADYLVAANPKIIWDLGSNVGRFSEIASSKGIHVIAYDSEMACIDSLYRTCRKKRLDNILPLVMDIMNPTPALGWSLGERKALSDRKNADLIMALAVVHHLAIANNVPLTNMACYFSDLCRWLIIEFIPKSDPKTAKMLECRDDIFEDYDQGCFETEFKKYFEIIESETIKGSDRLLYLMRRRK